MMKSLIIEKIADMTGGEIISNRGSRYACSVHVDSRLVQENGVFFALNGSVTDGHNFLKSAVENGASVLVVSEYHDDYPVCVVKVEDTFKAFQKMAKAYKEMFDIPFVAITGSSGKTTTKDIIASVLAQSYCVHKTQGNLNSSTGAPLTVFDLDDTHEISVIEISMSSEGEILGNADIVRPNTVVMTNIGVCHIEFLKTRENIFKAKCEILTYMRNGDMLVLNADDKYLSTINSDVYDIMRVGIDNGDFRAYNIIQNENGSCFSVDIGGEKTDFAFKYTGLHNIRNCLSAICIGLKYGLDTEQIKKGLLAFSPSQNRMESININGIRLINDTYNANPDSVKAALDSLQAEAKGRKIAVLGDMYELGDFAEEKHYECGQAAKESGVDILFTVGDYGKDYVEGYESLGGTDYICCKDKSEAAENIVKCIKQGDTVLLKASRGVKLEEVFNNLIERLSCK